MQDDQIRLFIVSIISFDIRFFKLIILILFNRIPKCLHIRMRGIIQHQHFLTTVYYLHISHIIIIFCNGLPHEGFQSHLILQNARLQGISDCIRLKGKAIFSDGNDFIQQRVEKPKRGSNTGKQSLNKPVW